MIRRILYCTGLAVVALAAGARPAPAAVLRVMQPADRTVVRGVIQFQIFPEHAPNERIYDNPDVIILDEQQEPVDKVTAVRDPRSGICAVEYDTRKLKDGLYVIRVTYRTLLMGTTPVKFQEELAVGVRNTPRRAGRFTVELEQKTLAAGELGDLKVRVLDSRGQPMPGVRVGFRVDKGQTSVPAQITDSLGEAMANVTSEVAQAVTLTVTVEGLPVRTLPITFGPAAPASPDTAPAP